MSERPEVKKSGLKECCIALIEGDGRVSEELHSGDELFCEETSTRIVYRDGKWQWKGPM